MKLGELGEFGFIARIRAAVEDGAGVRLGIGDDCAALEMPVGELLLTTTDMLIEEVHFRRAWTGLEDLGYKSAAVNLSDIAAMGGTPRFLYLSLGVPEAFDVTDLEALVAGFVAAAGECGAALVGGDTCRSPGPLLISVTAEGSSPADQLVRRAGARAGDGIYVSGTLGDSALALRCLRQGKTAAPPLLARHRRPRARTGLGRSLAATGLATAMIDISDGLLADLGHVLTASAVGARLAPDDLPLSPTFRKALETDPDLLALALGGGEDYELLFTVPAEREREVADLAAAAEVPATRVGVVTASEGLVVRDGRGRDLAAGEKGFNHFAPR